MNDAGIDLTEQILKMITKDIKEKALEFEKGDVVNPSMQKRNNIIDIEKEKLRHQEIKSKAEIRTIINPSRKLDGENKKEIDSK